ncbi:MAG TPA: hypothetical protein ENJ09_08990 [Planctomycetes bacterium]|nr:hypothetical protein [Planctomycetota bacterium]
MAEIVDAEDLWERDRVTGAFRASPVDYLNELEAAIEALPAGPLRAGRSFFFELDRRSEAALAPVTLPPAEYAAHRSALNGALGGLVRRFESRFAGDGTPTPVSGALRQDVGHFSTLLARLARAAFPAAGTSESAGVEVPALAAAFERFANGELRLFLPGVGVWTTQPSSGFYFFFAELAFACIELDIDADLWRPVLPTLVATQRIFADLYRPDPVEVPAPDQADYHPRWFDASRQWTEERKRALRSEFSGLTPSDLDRAATAHAREAFPGHGAPNAPAPSPGKKAVPSPDPPG